MPGKSNSQAVSDALTITIPKLQEENKRLKEENAKLKERLMEADGRAQQLREQLWDMGVEGDLT